MSNRKIYIAVPTMNDREYIRTVIRCLDNATNKDDIVIGTSIFWKPEDISNGNKPFFQEIEEVVSKIKNVKHDILPFDNFPGVGNGRIESLKFYDDEKYYLSIDSHTQFEPGWDEQLIDSYESTSKVFGKKRVITAYLPGFFLDENDEIVELGDRPKWQFFCYDKSRSKNFPVPSDREIENDENPLYEHLIDDKYLPAKKISAHFTFTEAYDWVKNCRINLDKRIVFWAEEFYQSALAYSRGYNLVWTKEIFMRHLYSTSVSVTFNHGDGSLEEEEKRDSRAFKENKFQSEYEINDVYKKYFKDKLIYPPPQIVPEEQVLMELIKNTGYFGSMFRSPLGFCRYTGVNLETKKCSPWKEVPKLDVVFK